MTSFNQSRFLWNQTQFLIIKPNFHSKLESFTNSVAAQVAPAFCCSSSLLALLFIDFQKAFSFKLFCGIHKRSHFITTCFNNKPCKTIDPAPDNNLLLAYWHDWYVRECSDPKACLQCCQSRGSHFTCTYSTRILNLTTAYLASAGTQIILQYVFQLSMGVSHCLYKNSDHFQKGLINRNFPYCYSSLHVTPLWACPFTCPLAFTLSFPNFPSAWSFRIRSWGPFPIRADGCL